MTLSAIKNWAAPAWLGRPARYGLFALLGADLGFILLHVAKYLIGFSDDYRLNISQDGGFAEIFQYCKMAGLVLLLSALAVQQKTRLYAAWAVLFAGVLIDDAFQLHEQIGFFLANTASVSSPTRLLRAVDIGEAIGFAAMGICLLGLVIFSHRRSYHPKARATSQGLGLLLGLLVICGVGFDLMHSLFESASSMGSFYGALANLFTVLEDGGEMVVLSAMLWFVGQAYWQQRFALAPARKAHQKV
jgi:hypothetical protein